jgi:signal transduction histidine kinase
VEEGRFLRIVAATGQLASIVGTLVPADQSLVGWVVTHDEPLLTPDQDADPRSFKLENSPGELHSAAIAPLRSAGVVIGTISVYNRRGGGVFGLHDLQLLQTLGDQVVVGLDRAAMLEESRRSEHVLAQKNQELQRATRLKSEFLANMSHELRTPLNAIIGFSDLILTGAAGEFNETQRDFLEAVLRNGRHLLALINSVLDLSKIEAGRMVLSLASTAMSDAIRDAVTDTASLRSAKEQSCTVLMDEADDLVVVADGGRIRQILYNLLSNASKFTTAGGDITVSAVRTRTPLPSPSERAADNDSSRLLTRESVWISVSDTGIGIRSDDMPKLFQEFSQVDSALNRQQQGTGLGLALCKSFVELHGGTIGAESLLGRGSTFWFILPVDGPIRRGSGLLAGETAAVAD